MKQVPALSMFQGSYIGLQTGPVVGLAAGQQDIEQAAQGPDIDGLAVRQVFPSLRGCKLLQTRAPCQQNILQVLQCAC